MSEEFYKNWDASKSQNNNGAVPFYRPIELTEEEKAQARKNIGVTGSPDITNLENKVDELEGDVASLSGTVGTVSSQFSTLSGNVDEALTSANAALAAVGTFSADLYEVSGKADTNSGNIDALSAQVVTNTTNIGSVSGKNTVQDNQISSLSGDVVGLTNSAVYHEAKIQNLETEWSAYSADLRNDFNTFSAAEDAVITAATAAIPGQVSAEVSGQLSGKQDKLTTANAGINLSISTAGVIDVKNNACSAPGSYGVAIGYYTSAIGSNSFAHGANSIANGLCSHAEGISAIASGTYSHAEGNGCVAGTQAHAEGINTYAIGAQSHAEGNGCSAVASISHVEGRGTISDTNHQHVEGRYNAPASGALHVIGNGNSSAERSNIVETYTSGVNVNGNLIASGVNIIENMNTMAALSTVYSGAQNIVISPVDRDNFEMIKNTALTGTNATFNYFNNKLYVNMDTFKDGNNTIPRFYVNGSNKHCTIERFNIDTDRVYSLFRGSSIIIDEIKEWGKYIVSVGYNYCPFYYTTVNKLPDTWEGFSGWPISIGSRMFEASTFKDIPSDYSTIHLTNSAANYNFSYMFTNNVQLSGGAVEFMDWVLAEESANNNSYNKSACFRGCTAIPNYSTLTADSKYSAFF